MAAFLQTNIVDKTGTGEGGYLSTKYDLGKSTFETPNLRTFLTALNTSSPIVKSQWELRYSRWPRSIFYAKSVSIPGINTFTTEISRNGFTIAIPMFVKYDSREIQLQILADKEGYHYQDWRSMVLQSGHPLVAGDTKATFEKVGGVDDFLDVRLRNDPDNASAPHHHWIIHNFRPTQLGEVELSHDDASFLTFQVTGTFTHIDYDCGRDDQNSGSKNEAEIQKSDSSSPEVNGGQNSGNAEFSNAPQEDLRTTEPPPDMNRVEEVMDENEGEFTMNEQSKDPGDLWPENVGQQNGGSGENGVENRARSGFDFDDGAADSDSMDMWMNAPKSQLPSDLQDNDSSHVVRKMFLM